MRFFVTAGVTCLLMSVGQVGAVLTAYVDNPHTNSVDWANAVTAAGGRIVNLNFDDIPAGPLTLVSTGNYILNAYQESRGVSFSVKGNAPAITNGVGPADSGIYSQNTGEGTHAASNYMSFPAPDFFGGGPYTTSITVNFDSPVGAVGFFSIDLASWTSAEILTIEAFTGPDASGTSLGTATSFNPAFFQPRYMYFMGFTTDTNEIGSFQIRGNWQNQYIGDSVGFDDFRFALIPEPTMLVLLTLGGLSFLRRRTRKA